MTPTHPEDSEASNTSHDVAMMNVHIAEPEHIPGKPRVAEIGVLQRGELREVGRSEDTSGLQIGMPQGRSLG